MQPTLVVVVDTSVLYSNPQPFEIDEIRALATTIEFVIPSTVLWELDLLMQRRETRDRARAAVNALKPFVKRGAANQPVSCGPGMTIRIASRDTDVESDGLDLKIADDRILATCTSLAQAGNDVQLATTEFALHVKALTIGISGIHLDNYDDKVVAVTRRERASFQDTWQRVQAAQSPWKLCRRGLTFLNAPLMRRILGSVRATGQPVPVAWSLQQFDALNSQWTASTNLNSLLKPIFGLDPPANVDFSVKTVDEPAVYNFGQPAKYASKRTESPDERTMRLRAEEEARSAREDYLTDVLFARLETLRDFAIESFGEDLL